MAVAPYGERLEEFLTSQGPLGVRRLRLQSHFHSLDWQAVDAWLAAKDAEGKARAEDRSEESLSISHKALRNSDRATNIAISAIVLSIIMAIQKLVEWYSR